MIGLLPATAIIAMSAFLSLHAMSGRAVTVVTSAAPGSHSRLLVSTIVDNSVTKQDTILDAGRFYFPTWSFDGTRIAFFRRTAGVTIIDADGGNVRYLAQTVNWGIEDLEQAIAWPGTDGGKWIYYHKPGFNCFRGGTGEIWKVNVDDPSQNVLICDYKKINHDTLAGWYAPGLYKFSLSTDAKYCVTHANGTAATLGYDVGIAPHTFPPQTNPGTSQINPWLTAPQCLSSCGFPTNCNSGLSTSGEIYYYFVGPHNQIYASHWDHAANTMTGRYTIGTGPSGSLDQYGDVQSWLTSGPGVGACFVYPRGSSNSDQVLTTLTAYQYGASYGPAACGNNMVVVNWKEKKAVMATNHPEPPHPDGTVAEGTHFWFAEPGDFRVDNGPAGCYQDVNGNWVDVPGALVTGAIRGREMSLLSTRGREQAVRGAVEVYDLKGARIGEFHAQATGRRAPPQLHRTGTCVLAGRDSRGRTSVWTSAVVPK